MFDKERGSRNTYVCTEDRDLLRSHNIPALGDDGVRGRIFICVGHGIVSPYFVMYTKNTIDFKSSRVKYKYKICSKNKTMHNVDINIYIILNVINFIIHNKKQ